MNYFFTTTSKLIIKKWTIRIALLITALCLVAMMTVSGLVAWILVSPLSFWNFTNRYLLPEDLNISWEQVAFTTQKKSWREWDVSWSTKDLSVSQQMPLVKLGFDQAVIHLNINIWTQKPWFVLETLNINVREHSFVKLSPLLEPREEPTPQSLYQQTTTALSYLAQSNRLAVIQNLSLVAPSFELTLANGELWTVSGQILKNHAATHNQEINFNISVKNKELLKANILGALNSLHYDTEQPFLQMTTELKTKMMSLRGEFLGHYKNNKIHISGQPHIEVLQQKNIIQIDPSIDLKMQEDFADIHTQLQISGIPGPIVRLNKVTATVRLPFTNNVAWSKQPATFKVESPIDLFLIAKDMRVPLESACRCRLPEVFAVSFEGKIWMDKLIDTLDEKLTPRQLLMEAQLKLESIKNKLFAADASAHIQILRDNKEWLIEPNLDAKIVVYSFQGLREFLDAKGYIIPAPLDVLEGTLQLTAKSPITRDPQNIKTNVEFDVDLKSKTQKALISTTTRLSLDNTFKNLDADVSVMIQKLKLELPPLDPVLGIPALTTDARVLKKPIEQKTSDFKVRVFSQVQTKDPGSIQLLSKYTKPHVPLTVSVKTKESKASGFVRLEPFTVSYLRRDIYLEKMLITLEQKEDPKMPIDGRFKINQGGYKIFINLTGTVDSPTVQLESEPHLSKSDIISVLLYGRVNDNLVSSEAETAGSFNAAMTDRAIGIFGLWAFASTPIQSFSYNAATKVYTATVKLGTGLTAGVGTNWEQATNLELRKRLSQKWVLTASWAPTQDNRQEGRLVLQWEKRF